MNLKSKCFVLALGHRSAATPLRAVGLALALSVLAGQAQSAECPAVAVCARGADCTATTGNSAASACPASTDRASPKPTPRSAVAPAR